MAKTLLTRDEMVESFQPGGPQPRPAPETGSSPPQPEPQYTDHPPLMMWPPEFLLVINALRRNSASELAALSGGEYLHFTTQRNFDANLQRISNQIHDYYLLRYQPRSLAFGLHTITVRVAGHPDAVIQTRKSYWAGMGGQ